MIIGFRLFVAFWIVLLACQYYYLYRKFEHLSVCRMQTERADALQMQIDQIKKN